MADLIITLGSHFTVFFVMVAAVGLVGGQRVNLLPLAGLTLAWLVYLAALIFGKQVFQLPGLEAVSQLLALSDWNWGGKLVSVLAIAAMVLVVAVIVPGALARMGFTLRHNPGSVQPALAVAAMMIAFGVAWSIYLNDGVDFTSDELAFQALMPGLDEEPMFRGLLPFLLALALGGNDRRFLHLSLSGVVVTVIFSLAHGLAFQEGQFVFNAASVLATGIVGLCLLWIRERTGSLVMPILMHNAFNVTIQFF